MMMTVMMMMMMVMVVVVVLGLVQRSFDKTIQFKQDSFSLFLQICRFK